MPIWISSRTRAVGLAERHKASHLVGLLAPGDTFPKTDAIPCDRHLTLELDDIPEPEPERVLPSRDHVQALLDFAGGWDRTAPIVVHCWAGVSRSTAAAFTIACLHNPGADEFDIAETLRQYSPTASPNPVIVAHADALLGRRGRMVDAARAIGLGAPAFEAMPFRLPSVFDSRRTTRV